MQVRKCLLIRLSIEGLSITANSCSIRARDLPLQPSTRQSKTEEEERNLPRTAPMDGSGEPELRRRRPVRSRQAARPYDLRRQTTWRCRIRERNQGCFCCCCARWRRGGGGRRWRKESNGPVGHEGLELGLIISCGPIRAGPRIRFSLVRKNIWCTMHRSRINMCVTQFFMKKVLFIFPTQKSENFVIYKRHI